MQDLYLYPGIGEDSTKPFLKMKGAQAIVRALHPDASYREWSDPALNYVEVESKGRKVRVPWGQGAAYSHEYDARAHLVRVCMQWYLDTVWAAST